jgi:ABC-type polysaccharide/polyol phosphate transport system ATPase subunit
MGDAAIRVQGVSKKFARRIRHNMLYGTVDVARAMLGVAAATDTLRPGEFWAVDDVSFELKKGEMLGLIGPNGSGKSTLLRLLNGIYQPDRGRIEMHGRVGALIAVGAGFHPLMTGRENIYLNGAILGMSRSEIDRKFDAIVEFADVGEFLDAPVKTYSSGMYVRLGFAIAIHCEPDILLVDEVLAVGDFGFRQKCFGKINEIREQASVIFVSHNLREINMLCDRALVLDEGRVSLVGKPDVAVSRFMGIVSGRGRAGAQSDPHASRPAWIFGERFKNPDGISDVRHVWTDGDGVEVVSVPHGRTLSLEFSFRLLKPAGNLVVGVPVWDDKGNLVTALNTNMQDVAVKEGDDGVVSGSIVMDRVVLKPGSYISAFTVLDSYEFLYRDFNKDFSVTGKPLSLGYFTHEHRWVFR